MAATFHEVRQIFLIISRSVVLRMTNVSEKFVEEIKTHFMFKKLFFFSKIVPLMR